MLRIVAHARCAVLMRTVPGDAFWIDLVDLLCTGGVENFSVMVDDPPPHLEVVGMDFVGNYGNW